MICICRLSYNYSNSTSTPCRIETWAIPNPLQSQSQTTHQTSSSYWTSSSSYTQWCVLTIFCPVKAKPFQLSILKNKSVIPKKNFLGRCQYQNKKALFTDSIFQKVLLNTTIVITLAFIIHRSSIMERLGTASVYFPTLTMENNWPGKCRPKTALCCRLQSSNRFRCLGKCTCKELYVP